MSAFLAIAFGDQVQEINDALKEITNKFESPKNVPNLMQRFGGHAVRSQGITWIEVNLSNTKLEIPLNGAAIESVTGRKLDRHIHMTMRLKAGKFSSTNGYVKTGVKDQPDSEMQGNHIGYTKCPSN